MKEKLLTIMLSLFCLTVAGQNDQNTYKLRGDVNGDGIVNQADVDIVANYIMGTSTGFSFEDVDVNNDGYANAADIVKIVEVINSGNVVVKYMFVWKSDGSRVTYDLDDGTASPTLEPGKAVVGTKMDAPTATITKSSYDFAGWYDGDKLFDFSKPVEKTDNFIYPMLK